MTPVCHDGSCYTIEGTYPGQPSTTSCNKIHLDESQMERRIWYDKEWTVAESCSYSSRDTSNYAQGTPMTAWVQYRVLLRRMEDSLTYVQRRFNDEGITDFPAIRERTGTELPYIIYHIFLAGDHGPPYPQYVVVGPGVEGLCHALILGIKLLKERKGLDMAWYNAREIWNGSNATRPVYDSCPLDECCSDYMFRPKGTEKCRCDNWRYEHPSDHEDDDDDEAFWGLEPPREKEAVDAAAVCEGDLASAVGSASDSSDSSDSNDNDDMEADDELSDDEDE